MGELKFFEPQNETLETQLRYEFDALKASYKALPSPTYQHRKNILLKLKRSLIENEQAIYNAVKQDYGYRSEFDSLIADVLPSVAAINYTLKNLKKWMKPSRRHAGLLLAPSSVKVHYQPLGVVGVITPWNFPFFLALGPAIQALAAGNRVMIKMSEFTPATNRTMRDVIEPISEHVVIVEGEADVGAAFSALPFDHLIFTGSTTVGKHVATAAAQNLTPITLEMGGKSPTIVDSDIDMDAAVDAISVGKSINSGQICVSPDYVFVPEPRVKEFVETFRRRHAEYYIDDKNKNRLTHIVSDRQYDRLVRFLEDAVNKGADIHAVEERNERDGRRVYPHLITNVSDDMLIMQEEIFGSLLPIKPYTSISEVINYINDRPRPLALYIMSDNNEFIKNILENTHSGGVSINDTAMHVAADDAPFGGIGPSGMGHYHGHEGFLTFSKAKTVLRSKSWLAKNRFILQNRDLVFNMLRKVLLR